MVPGVDYAWTAGPGCKRRRFGGDETTPQVAMLGRSAFCVGRSHMWTTLDIFPSQAITKLKKVIKKAIADKLEPFGVVPRRRSTHATPYPRCTMA